MKTLKVEEVYLMAYETFDDVAVSLPRLIDEVYNSNRSAIGAPSGSNRSTPGRAVASDECGRKRFQCWRQPSMQNVAQDRQRVNRARSCEAVCARHADAHPCALSHGEAFRGILRESGL